MADKNISRFCELVSQINKANKKLDKKRSKFNRNVSSPFYTGDSIVFEEKYEFKILELEKLQTELRNLFIQL